MARLLREGGKTERRKEVGKREWEKINTHFFSPQFILSFVLFKSQEINEMKYLSRPLKSMEDWIYGSLPWPKFTNAAKQLSVSSGKWLTALSPIRAFDFVSNARLWKNKKIWARRSPKGSVFFTKKNLYLFYLLFFKAFRLKTDIWQAEMHLDKLTLLCLSTN